MKIPNGDTCTMATLNMLFARGGVGVLDRIDRIMRVRVESWSSRKELRTIPLSRLRQGYGGQANSNYFLQLSLLIL